MENSKFETILTVKEFDSCCTFYHGLLPDLKICVAGSFLMKIALPCGRTLKINAFNTLFDNPPQKHDALNIKLESSDLEHAVEFLLQHNIKFTTTNNEIHTSDPAGNTLIISGNENCDLDSISSNQKTRKVEIA